MKEKLKLLKLDLLNHIRETPLDKLSGYLEGRDGIRSGRVDVNGVYCCNTSGDGISIIEKDGLILTLEIDKDYEENSDEIFENTQEYEDGIDFEEWDGTWKIELDEHSGIHLLLTLIGE